MAGRVGNERHFLSQTSEMRIYKAELYHLGQQKEKVDEVRACLLCCGYCAHCCVVLCALLQVKANLEEAQKKVENSKVDITRIMNELSPQEVSLK